MMWIVGRQYVLPIDRLFRPGYSFTLPFSPNFNLELQIQPFCPHPLKRYTIPLLCTFPPFRDPGTIFKLGGQLKIPDVM